MINYLIFLEFTREVIVPHFHRGITNLFMLFIMFVVSWPRPQKNSPKRAKNSPEGPIKCKRGPKCGQIKNEKILPKQKLIVYIDMSQKMFLNLIPTLKRVPKGPKSASGHNFYFDNHGQFSFHKFSNTGAWPPKKDFKHKISTNTGGSFPNRFESFMTYTYIKV